MNTKKILRKKAIQNSNSWIKSKKKIKSKKNRNKTLEKEADQVL